MPEKFEGVSRHEKDGFKETAQEYFDRQDGTPYTLESESEDSVRIEIRPGLVAKVIAAGVAIERKRPVNFEILGEEFTVTPEEATGILQEKMGDILEVKE